MKYFIVTLFVFLTIITNNSPTKNKLKLAKHYKVEQTFSGNTATNNTFHLIVAKNNETKLFEIIPLTFSNGEINQLVSVIFQDKPEILSYHNNNNVLSLITSSKEDKEKVILIHDLNLESGEITKSKNHNFKDYKSVIQKTNSSLLLYANADNFKVVNVTNANQFNETIVDQNEENKAFLKTLDKEKLDAINSDEFVANGSIGSLRAYSNNNLLRITQEDENENATTVSTIDLSVEGLVSFNTNDFKSDIKLKKSTSYISDNELIRLNLDKKNGNINIYNLEDDSKKSLDLNKLKPTKKSSGFEDMETFLKVANKSANAATITANKTKTGALVLRADYVNKERYYYDNFWFHHWFHHNQMMLHQQNMQQNVPRFGPSEFLHEEDLYFEKDEQHYFEIVLSENRDVLNEEVQTIYKDYNKKKHLEKLKENKSLDHISATFKENDLIYLAYNKKTKEFGVYKKTVLK